MRGDATALRGSCQGAASLAGLNYDNYSRSRNCHIQTASTTGGLFKYGFLKTAGTNSLRQEVTQTLDLLLLGGVRVRGLFSESLLVLGTT